MIYWYAVAFFLTSFYILLIAFFYRGLLLVIKRTKREKLIVTNEKSNKFSVIIAARNEAHFIKESLHSIINQNYNKNLFEIIVINDHSTDGTLNKIEDFIAENSEYTISCINLEELDNITNKKQAISIGINNAKHDYIILTDADCIRKNEWLNSINIFIEKTNSKLVYAPVEFLSKNIFEEMQALEFAGLVGVGAAAMELKYPNMCSASNLILEKKVFYEVGGYEDNKHVISGDDEFLMHKIFKKYPNQVKFLFNENAIVKTSANASVNELTEQRKRWVSKATKYENRYITIILIFTYYFNFSIIINLFVNWQIAVTQLGLKFLIEGIFLFTILKLYNKKRLILLLPLAEIFHVFYIVIIGVLATFTSFNWKGRIHK